MGVTEFLYSEAGGTSSTTTELEVITLPLPILTPFDMVTPKLNQTSSSMSIGADRNPGKSLMSLGWPRPPLPAKLTPLHPDHFHHQGA
jgi:hypothetical protein